MPVVSSFRSCFYAEMEPKVQCNVCKKRFSKHSNLRQHVKRFHPDKLNEIAANKIHQSVVLCPECKKSFSRHSNFKKHAKKFHSSKADDLAPKKTYNHQCEECHKNFSHLRNLKYHKKIHQLPTNVVDQSNSLKCPLCQYQNLSKSKLIDHFEQIHTISIESENVEFSTMEEFQLWKSDIENKSKSSFIHNRGSYTTQNTIKTIYVCHRSGRYITKGKGLRHLKTQGSNKINGFCPASLHVTMKNGKCEVKYIKSHVGHDCDLKYLRLTSSQRQELATKIAAKIPLPTILDEIRDSITNCELERVHLLTKKDLYNIEQSFQLRGKSVRHKNDAVSVKSWILEMEKNGCVLFYKPQGTISENYPNLKQDDFVLIIMNQGQEEILQKYGSDCICLDGTHGMNGYGYELNTLFVLDDMREGFPCSFLISNRSDEEMMRIFFSHIREKIEMQIKPKIFMSDMVNSFYNAWEHVMHPAEYRLFCTWHIDRDWRKNLSKIAGKENQATVYQMLRTLLQERDIAAFSIMIEQFLTSLAADSQTLEFANYFKNHYANKVEAWASCYRLHSGLNSNMHIERMHRTIKYLYLNGKHVKRLDKAIHAILKFVRDKLFERLIVFNNQKFCTKMKNLKSSHKASLSLDIGLVLATETGWEVPSTSSHEVYAIEERKIHCSCKLFCSECNACLHRYSCSCLDSSIKWNMCKHIHLLCRYKNSLPENSELTVPETQDSEGENRLFIHTTDSGNETFKIVEALSKSSSEASDQLHEKKEKLKEKLKMAIDNITSLEELAFVTKIIASIQPTLAAMKTQKSDARLVSSIPVTHSARELLDIWKREVV